MAQWPATKQWQWCVNIERVHCCACVYVANMEDEYEDVFIFDGFSPTVADRQQNGCSKFNRYSLLQGAKVMQRHLLLQQFLLLTMYRIIVQKGRNMLCNLLLSCLYQR